MRATAAEIVGTNVVVHGVALDQRRQHPLPLSRVEQRIVNPDFREAPEPLERRDIRATTDDGNLVRDNSPGAAPGAFIATHSRPDRRAAAEGGRRPDPGPRLDADRRGR